MPIVTQCTAPGCETLTMGPLCLEHEKPRARIVVRGRPAAHFVVDATGGAATSLAEAVRAEAVRTAASAPVALRHH